MSDFINSLHPTLKPITISAQPNNDNVVITADLFVAARMFSELHRRWRSLDPQTLSAAKRIYRAQVLAWSRDSILFCWNELSRL